MLIIKRVPIVTDADGDDRSTVGLAGHGRLAGVFVEHGTLDAGANITITDEPAGRTLLALEDVAANGLFPLAVPACDTAGEEIEGAFATPLITGRIQIVTDSGGDTLAGQVTLYMER